MKLSIVSGVVTAIALVVVIGFSDVGALSSDAQCAAVEAVYARGSGQDLASAEATRFNSLMQAGVPSAVGLKYYELGTEKYGNDQYAAVDVNNIWNGNPVGAKFSSGQSFDYGRSVQSGVGELTSYLAARHEKCKGAGTKYVIAGYSQGAQVVGQALPLLAKEIRDDVVFVSLFGDPKLHLPEGEGFNPPACRGQNLSTYRRMIASCDVDNGSLGARKPYLPVDIKDRVGLWCNSHDYVCGSSKNPLDAAGHGTYSNQGEAVDLAVVEAIDRLSRALPADKVRHLIKPKVVTNLDVVFVIDTTMSMSWRIEQAKQYARTSADRIKQQRGRVALVSYRDLGDDYVAKVISPLSADIDLFQAGLDSLQIGDGGDTPEALLHALMTAFNELDWKSGSTKAAVVLTDAGFHDPDKFDGTTMDDVVRRSLEIDPVNVYPVIDSWSDSQDAYQALADRTSGQVIYAEDGDTAGALDQAMTKIYQRPVALLKLPAYSADVGQQVTFDASDSYVDDAMITKYEWDFDGDGIFDLTTTSPVADHTYPVKFDGQMQVRLTASNDTISSASVPVEIGVRQPPVLPAAPVNLKVDILDTKQAVSAVRLSWVPGDSTANEWVVSVNDVAVGRSAGGVTSVELTDVKRGDVVTLSVAGVGASREVGESASLQLPKVDATAPVDPPASSSPPRRSWFAALVKFIVQTIRHYVVVLRW